MLRHLLALPLASLVVAGPALAEGPPPERAAAYTAVYKSVSNGKPDPYKDEWTVLRDDTITIAVSGDKARWDHKSDGLQIIYDYAAKTMTEFGGKIPAGNATRTAFRQMPIRWELGYVGVAKATETTPTVLGTDTVAGEPCTRLTYDSAQYGKPEFCVTKDGIPLRFTNRSSNAEIKFEATSVKRGEPDAESFRIPTTLTIKDQRI